MVVLNLNITIITLNVNSQKYQLKDGDSPNKLETHFKYNDVSRLKANRINYSVYYFNSGYMIYIC